MLEALQVNLASSTAQTTALTDQCHRILNVSIMPHLLVLSAVVRCIEACAKLEARFHDHVARHDFRLAVRTW